nr:15758_t:CDS:2 [Entrophospora candida]
MNDTNGKKIAYYNRSAIPILPHPPQSSNKDNCVISLNNFVQWLGDQAEAENVELYVNFAGSEVLYNQDGSVRGVVTNDMIVYQDINKQIQPSRRKTATNLWNWDKRSLGNRSSQGLVVHTIGYPMDYKTYGGGFMYHMENNILQVGYVVGLDYQNPYLNPYKEFQKYKLHLYIRKFLEGAKVTCYGARALNEGGYQECLQEKQAYKALASKSEASNSSSEPIIFDEYEKSIENSWNCMKKCKPIEYPKPDGKITFDLLESVSRSGTNHSENQPVRLRLRDEKVLVERNLKIFDVGNNNDGDDIGIEKTGICMDWHRYDHYGMPGQSIESGSEHEEIIRVKEKGGEEEKKKEKKNKEKDYYYETEFRRLVEFILDCSLNCWINQFEIVEILNVDSREMKINPLAGFIKSICDICDIHTIDIIVIREVTESSLTYNVHEL